VPNAGKRHRSRHGLAADGKADVDGPVERPGSPNFPGAIEGVNDPDALVAQPLGLSAPPRRAARPRGRAQRWLWQELVGSLVASWRASSGTARHLCRAQLDQEAVCFAGQASGLEVVRRRDTGNSDPVPPLALGAPSRSVTASCGRRSGGMAGAADPHAAGIIARAAKATKTAKRRAPFLYMNFRLIASSCLVWSRVTNWPTAA